MRTGTEIKKFCRDNAWFLSTFVAVFIAGFVLWAVYDKADSHILLNSWHTPRLDIFFKYFTEIGGGLPAYVGIAALLLSIRGGLDILLSQLLSLILTHAVKYSVAAPRPVTFFSEIGRQMPDVVEGVYLNTVHSFPSGHTSAVFAFCMCLAAMLPKKYKWLGCALCIIAALGSYSRIYLSQHFLEDTLAGALIGILSAAAIHIWLYDCDKIPSKGIIRLIRDKKA